MRLCSLVLLVWLQAFFQPSLGWLAKGRRAISMLGSSSDVNSKTLGGDVNSKKFVGVVAGLALALGGSGPAFAETYQNPRYHTTFEPPAGWTFSTGQISGERKVEAWVDPKNAVNSVSLVISPVPADFTRLTSFGGGKDTLQEYLIPRGEGIECTVVDEKVKGETYTLEYIVAAPNNPTRHVITAFALRPAESVVGLTVTAEEAEWRSLEASLSRVIPSLNVQADI